ncbi:hypothetical protein CKM354_000873100 [Cercospora kikuchii]|uniref:Uncharacterized protein n=1 Tax=Cercospora kikuchii TaxID=84275 RepID=A0A9P3FFL3_9PEZI|nr:uncharacterized protein CKM354_000873100 [Cercospora kikuchii]GIZ45571.1 hypothetical protein CKM354_000873100 [Cercospora kikuchii]
MPDFWDLPRKVRDKIYRMHLVHDKPIGRREHDEMCNRGIGRYHPKRMPTILRVSARADREAAPIYYGENHFVSSWLHPDFLVHDTFARHYRLVRRLTCDWDPSQSGTNYAFDCIAKLKGLVELTIEVDEKDMVRQALIKRDTRQSYWAVDGEYSAQEQLALYHLKGIDRLLSLKGIPNVNFGNRTIKGKKEAGPIPGGVLLTQIRPKIMASAVTSKKAKLAGPTTAASKKKKSKAAYFDFFGLPPELRNRIYDMLLGIDGPIHPSKKPPSTTARKTKDGDDAHGPLSALCLLAVNKQIRDEAVGIYYATPLVFYYSCEFHAFALGLGQLRRSVVRDITIHYDNVRRGDTDSEDLTAPLLREFTGLKKLQIVMFGTLETKIRMRRRWSSGWTMDNANPAAVPGMKALFDLRNLEYINIRDVRLEELFDTAKKDKGYPDFEPQSRSYQVVKLTAALAHFNKALLDAQQGKVNREVLKNNGWHTWDDFPEFQEEESDDEDEADDEEDGDEEDSVAADVENDTGDSEGVTAGTASGDARAPGPRRSARLSAKATEAVSEQQDDVEDMDVEADVGGRGASPEL